MAVRTSAVTSGSGWAIGSTGAAKERLADVDYLRVAFDSFDVDKSGFIDPQELCAALTMLGIRGKLVEEIGLDDVDGDGVISLKDLDKNGDEKIDFDEFKILAAILPKRDHSIYRGALSAKKVELPRDQSRATPVQRNQYNAQKQTEDALNSALRRLRTKLKITTTHKLMNDSFLQKAFKALDESGDGRVDSKEILKLLQDPSDGTIRVEGDADTQVELDKKDAWLLMNCADSNNDKHMTFDEFKKMLQTLAKDVL